MPRLERVPISPMKPKFCKMRDLAPKSATGTGPRPPNFVLTFDLDWCHEEVLLDTISLLAEYEVKAVLFVTNTLPALEALGKNDQFELGIHPNFNSLLSGGRCPMGDLSAEKEVDRLMAIVPDAKSVRSHSLCTSTRLTELFRAKGLTHESNLRLPASPVAPFRHHSGMIMCPFSWSDYTDAHTAATEACARLPYFMCAFHPIHVFLNTESLARYEATRDFHQNPSRLRKCRFEGIGVRSRLTELLALASAHTCNTCDE